MWAIIKKEVKNYFYSPIGYVFIGAFMLLSSIFFYLFVLSYGSVEFSGLFYSTSELLTFTVALLTMGMFAGERKNGTETLLLTSSRSITSIVIRKIFSSTCSCNNYWNNFTNVLCNLMHICRRAYKCYTNSFSTFRIYTNYNVIYLIWRFHVKPNRKSNNSRNYNSNSFAGYLVFTKFVKWFCNVITNKFLPKIPTGYYLNYWYSRTSFNNSTIYSAYNNYITEKKEFEIKRWK